MRLVVALGGNALSRRGEPFDVEAMRRRVGDAADELARAAGHAELAVTHGNGPQVGFLALQAEAVPGAAPTPLDVLGAESEGMIGFVLEEALASRLPGREIAALLTQVEVDPADPAFARPDKPIGPVYPRAEGARLAAARGWTMTEDRGGLRRVVASPSPLAVRELRTIARLVEAGVVVVCAGGGGVPVVTKDGVVRGVPAVVDKDLTAALLAQGLGADRLVLLTDVDAVYADWPAAREPIGRASAGELRARAFPAGSMGPKVEAACRFAEATGRPASIGALGALDAILEGRAGTCVVGEG